MGEVKDGILSGIRTNLNYHKENSANLLEHVISLLKYYQIDSVNSLIDQSLEFGTSEGQVHAIKNAAGRAMLELVLSDLGEVFNAYYEQQDNIGKDGI